MEMVITKYWELYPGNAALQNRVETHALPLKAIGVFERLLGNDANVGDLLYLHPL